MKVAEVQLSYKSEVKPSERPQITSSKDAADILRSFEAMSENIEYKELFLVMALNRNNKVLSICKISEGGSAGTVVEPKQVMQSLILQNASSFILCHNHPGGNLNPSEQDKQITKRLKDIGTILEIRLHDHIILTPEAYTSFADEALM